MNETVSSKRLRTGVILLPIILVLYGASIGPFFWLDFHGYLDTTPDWIYSVFDLLFRPVFALDNVPYGGQLLRWYLHLWV